MKRQIVTLSSTLLSLLLLTGTVFAQQIGVVDIQELTQKYSKAQELQAQIKAKDEELQKLRGDLLEQLKAGEKLSPVEKKNLEDKLNGQFAAKFTEYREWAVTQEKGVREDVDKAISQVTQAQKLEIVFPKQTVLSGGKDITADVLNALNK